MVKNTTGGSRHKSQARKNVMSAKSGNGALRMAQEEGEMYAQVEKILGGSNCQVRCIDGIQRLCVIRGKFRGRGKRDNTLSKGTLVLVGLREYESSYGNTTGAGSKIKDKLQNCDLLEVYRETDKTRIRKADNSINWSLLTSDTKISATTEVEEDDEFVDFMTDEQIELENMIQEQENAIAIKTNTKIEENIEKIPTMMGFGDEEDESDFDIDDL